MTEKSRLRPVILALTAALLAACAGIQSWPTRSDPAAGAVLFKLKADKDVSGMKLANLIFPFYLPGEDRSSHLFYVDPNKVNEFPNDVILVSLPPGTYTSVQPRFGVVGNNYHVVNLDIPSGSFKNIKILPGKVTVLGALDMTMKVFIESYDAGGQTFNWKGSKLAYDDRPATKKAVLEAALARPEAVQRKWKDALEAAKKELDEQ